MVPQGKKLQVLGAFEGIFWHYKETLRAH